MDTRKFICYIDGACEPTNPGGHMGIGAAVFENGVSIYSYSQHVPLNPKNSNNVAEYSALLKLIDWLVEQELTDHEILVRGDSKLVVNQMSGQWNINSGLYAPFAYEATKKIRQFKNIRFEWIPREMNEFADELSKTEMKKAGVEFRIQKY